MQQGGVPLQARKGRSLQKYDAGHRLVAGCIPVRHVHTNNGNSQVEILMITSKSSDLLVLPKGGWETDETLEAAAARETLEEAGVVGDLVSPCKGPFTFSSKANSPCKAYMYIMQVRQELEDWPERSERRRSWHSVEEAAKLCKWDWMRDALSAFKEEDLVPVA
ncbi:MutT/NUDIX hydrolase [Chloropicon roscoffensis]|uniref:MutT/NUDIX hydrolase n=2 Tax=Chloropicon roscoffensis TaxID=1461544 RepID=A0AAX4P3L8_9CHLO